MTAWFLVGCLFLFPVALRCIMALEDWAERKGGEQKGDANV